MALCALCGGDGLAVFGGMLGQKLGLQGKVPWNTRKVRRGRHARARK